MDKENQKAFTLIELSIVLIIIGFIIAAVTSGLNMLKRARVKSVISESGNYMSAVNSFRDLYGYYPGDIPNATSVLSSSTVNGNGDGIIGWSSEAYNSWNHLVLAGKINFNWTSTQSEPISSYNSQSSWRLNAYGIVAWGVPAFTANALSLVSCGISNNASNCYLIWPSDAYAVDSKLDDGNPSTGKIVNAQGATNGCMINNTTTYWVSSYSSPGNVSYVTAGETTSSRCARLFFYF